MLFIVTDLERMADHAEGIASINLLLEPEPLPRELGYLPAMADRTVTMLRDSLKAYIDHDIDLAQRICDADDEVDRLQDAVYEEATRAMIDNPSTIQRNTHLLWTAHNIERIADRCTNICERVIYLVTGKMQEINVSKY
jgi:phosphate transport system protein